MNPASPVPALLAKYARPVPRYTSYPTAPHFDRAVDAATYGNWLEALAPAATLSLYVHIPYCRSLCWFCGCHTKVTNNYNPVSTYLDVVLEELALVSRHLAGPRPVTQIHFGGGTPTILAAYDLERLVDALRRRFAIRRDAEFAVEIDPRVLTSEQIAALARARVTRASLGVQDFDPAVQRAINRIQPYDVTARAVEGLRDAGIVRINFDLLYGLPHQSVEGLLHTIDQAVALAPDRIALFGYAHVPWMKKHQRLIPEAALPGPALRHAQAAAAAARLVERGYVAIGLDHFAAPGDPLTAASAQRRLGRNFQGYTDDQADALLGFGASAIGALPQGYVQNEADLKTYVTAITEQQLPAARGKALDADDRLRREIIQRLMCDFEVGLEAVCRRHRIDPLIFEPERAMLRSMASDGLVDIEQDRISVTDLGRPFVRAVAASFDRYLQGGLARHSIAV